MKYAVKILPYGKKNVTSNWVDVTTQCSAISFGSNMPGGFGQMTFTIGRPIADDSPELKWGSNVILLDLDVATTTGKTPMHATGAPGWYPTNLPPCPAGEAWPNIDGVGTMTVNGTSQLVPTFSNVLFQGRLEGIARDLSQSIGIDCTANGWVGAFADDQTFRNVWVDNGVVNWHDVQTTRICITGSTGGGPFVTHGHQFLLADSDDAISYNDNAEGPCLTIAAHDRGVANDYAAGSTGRWYYWLFSTDPSGDDNVPLLPPSMTVPRPQITGISFDCVTSGPGGASGGHFVLQLWALGNPNSSARIDFDAPHGSRGYQYRIYATALDASNVGTSHHDIDLTKCHIYLTADTPSSTFYNMNAGNSGSPQINSGVFCLVFMLTAMDGDVSMGKNSERKAQIKNVRVFCSTDYNEPLPMYSNAGTYSALCGDIIRDIVEHAPGNYAYTNVSTAGVISPWAQTSDGHWHSPRAGSTNDIMVNVLAKGFAGSVAIDHYACEDYSDRGTVIDELNSYCGDDYGVWEDIMLNNQWWHGFTYKASPNTIAGRDKWIVSLEDPNIVSFDASYILDNVYDGVVVRYMLRNKKKPKSPMVQEFKWTAEQAGLTPSTNYGRYELLDLGSVPMTKAQAQSLASRFLIDHATPPLGGSVTLAGAVVNKAGEYWDARYIRAGQWIDFKDLPVWMRQSNYAGRLGLKILSTSASMADGSVQLQFGIPALRADILIARLMSANFRRRNALMKTRLG